MGNLIKNEFIKIFKKKGTYVVLVILLLFVILTNCIYKFMDTLAPGEDYKTTDQYIEYAKEQLNNIDVNSNREDYITYKTDIDYYELYKKYDRNSWQVYIIQRDFYDYLHNVNVYKYGTNIDKESFENNPEEEYNKALEKLNNSDWKVYVNEEIQQTESELNETKQQKQLLEGSASAGDLDAIINALEIKLELAKMRLEGNIPYGNDYINEAIDTKVKLAGLDYDINDQNMSYQDRVSKQQTIDKYENAKYIIETKQDINNSKTLRAGLIDVFDEFSIFIVIFVVMIAGGMISSEMEKGTIKILLVKPYKRWKILVSKYIVSIAMILFVFAITIIFELLVGGILLGFDSLSMPAVVYDFNSNSIQTFNVFVYVLIMAAHKLPMYILLGTLAFAISTIFSNTVLGVVLPIIGYIASSIINALLYMHPVKQLAFFPPLNWDFSQFMFGRLPDFEYTNFGFAVGVCVVCWAIMVGASLVFFKKKEIRNV